jgi:hypothetical protein
LCSQVVNERLQNEDKLDMSAGLHIGVLAPFQDRHQSLRIDALGQLARTAPPGNCRRQEAALHGVRESA